MNQGSFSDLEYQAKKKTTRKERFLNEMDQVLAWKQLLKPIVKHYPKPGNGRRPTSPEVMLRIYFLQQWYQLSDPAMEDGLYDSQAMRGFVNVGLDEVPDESTICRFRHFLEHHELTQKLFRISEQYLSKRGLMLSEGTIVDASIVLAPSSTKNQQRKRDEEMGSTKNGNPWYFGMKMHIGTDPYGRVHSVTVTDASVHDSQVFDDLVHGDESVLYGDKGYADVAQQQRYEESGVTWRVSRKARRNKKLNIADRSFNRKSNRVRARVEHVFSVVKHLWGYRKVRYKGIAKNAAQVFSLFALANFYQVRRELLPT